MEQYVNLERSIINNMSFTISTKTLILIPPKYGFERKFYIQIWKDKSILLFDQDEIITNNQLKNLFCMSNEDHAVFFSILQVYSLARAWLSFLLVIEVSWSIYTIEYDHPFSYRRVCTDVLIVVVVFRPLILIVEL